MIEITNIPEERKAVLIGKEGTVKKELEHRTHTIIKIENGVQIQGDTLDIIKAKEVIKAIGRGFSPEKAFKLLEDEYQLDVISLKGETPKKIKRLFARVIGTKGSTKRRIEMETGVDISVYGKTVSIIGVWGQLGVARKAVEDLLVGRSHAYVYNKLSRLSKNK